MPLTRRIIPCFDLIRGRVVKGIRMENVEDRADPVEVARAFQAQGADELALLDVSGSGRGELLADVLARVSEQVFVPVTAGGGIGEMQDIKRMLDAGADRVMLNTAAVLDPELVLRAVDRFGSECLVGAVDVRRVRTAANEDALWEVLTHGGRKSTGIDARAWVQRLADYGVGEVVLTSMDRDGTRKGFDMSLVETMSAISAVPLVVAGGAGEPQDIADAMAESLADGVMVASIFHSGAYNIGDVKEFLTMRGMDIRP